MSYTDLRKHFKVKKLKPPLKPDAVQTTCTFI